MSKLTQIESALKAIGTARFHELCDSYLYALGYRNINSTNLKDSLGSTLSQLDS